jgi:hypothetical protein
LPLPHGGGRTFTADEADEALVLRQAFLSAEPFYPPTVKTATARGRRFGQAAIIAYIICTQLGVAAGPKVWG